MTERIYKVWGTESPVGSRAKPRWVVWGMKSPYKPKHILTRMWANAQRDGRPAEYRWRPLFNAAKFG